MTCRPSRGERDARCQGVPQDDGGLAEPVDPEQHDDRRAGAGDLGAHDVRDDRLATWMAAHHVVSGAITDTLLLMAVGMLLTRALGLAIRAGALPPAATRDRDRAPVSR
jgi:hypothetical protein